MCFATDIFSNLLLLEHSWLLPVSRDTYSYTNTKEPKKHQSDMILAQLPRFHLSTFTKPTLSLSSSHFNLLNHRSNPPVSLARTLFSFPPKSNLATVEPIPLPVSDSSDLEDDAPVEIPLDKLFVPPETDISRDDLTARILKGSNIVLSKYARDAQVAQADYVKSSVRTEDCPADGLPEFALVGRSNVGKSSLLNSLVRRKRLALTSKKPGNHSFCYSVCVCDSLIDLLRLP